MQKSRHPLGGLFKRLVVVLVIIVMLWPFAWCLLLTFQSTAEINSAYASLLPQKIHWENYLSVLTNRGMLSGLLNSLIISLISVAVNLLISVPAGFALARVKMRLTNAFLRVLLMFVFVPVLLLAVPMRDMLKAWGLGGSHLMVALPLTALVATTLTFWRFYSRFPDEIDDCSVIFGMTPIQGFFRIYLPVSGRVMLDAAIMQFVTTWNCAFLPLFMYRRIDNINTIQDSLLQYANSPSHVFLGMVAVLVACLPCWLLYALRHRVCGTPMDSVADPFRNSN